MTHSILFPVHSNNFLLGGEQPLSFCWITLKYDSIRHNWMKRTIVNQFWNIIFINDAVILIAAHVEQWQCTICSIWFFQLKLSICKPRSQDNVISVWLVTGWMVQGLSSSRVERFSVIQFHPNWFWEPLNLLFIRCWGSYLEVKLPVDEAGHSPPPSAKFKNEWSYDTTPPVCLHGVERDNLLF